MLEAWPAVLLLSTIMPLAPPDTWGEFGPGAPLTRDITHPFLPLRQDLVTLQKRKSVPPPTLALKNSVTGPQRAALSVDSWTGLPSPAKFPLPSKGKL